LQVVYRSQRATLIQLLKPATIYFAVVFAAGFLLGTIRVLLIIPFIGVRAAELIETPVMLLISAFAARWILRQFPNIRGSADSLAVGLIAVVLLLAAELAVGVFLFHLPITDALVKTDPVLAVAYYGALCLYALMPFILRNRS
jgi:hypothetical protein